MEGRGREEERVRRGECEMGGGGKQYRDSGGRGWGRTQEGGTGGVSRGGRGQE